MEVLQIITLLVSLMSSTLSQPLSNMSDFGHSLLAKYLIETTEEIQRNKFLIYEDICIITSNDSDHRWTEITTGYTLGISNLYKPVTVTNLATYPLLSRGCSLYLIQLDSYGCTRFWHESMAKLPQLRNWNRFGKFIFATLSRTTGSTNVLPILKSYYNIVMQSGIASSILVLFEDQTAIPMTAVANYFRRSVQFHRVDAKGAATLLTMDHYADLHGYSFIVAKNKYVPFVNIQNNQIIGSTVFFVEAFCSKLNASCQWRTMPEDVHGALQSILNNEFNMVPHAFVQSPFTEMFALPQITGFCVVVPERKIERYFDHLMVPFDTTLWIALLLLGMVCAIFNHYLRRFYPRNLLEMTFFGPAIAEHRMGCVERTTFCLLSVLLFVLCEAYLAKLLTFILTTRYEKHVQTLDEFIQSGISVLVDNSTVTFWKQYRPEILKRAVFIHRVPNLFDPRFLSYARLMNCVNAKVNVEALSNIDPVTSRYRFYLPKERVTAGLHGHTISRIDPFGEKFRELFDRFLDCGLWDYWLRFVEAILRRDYELEYDFLSFEDLISMWYILLAGLLGSTVAFGFEVLVFWLCNCGWRTIRNRLRYFAECCRFFKKSLQHRFGKFFNIQRHS